MSKAVSSLQHRSFKTEAKLIDNIIFQGWATIRHYRVRTIEGDWTAIFSAGDADSFAPNMSISIASYKYLVVS
jgi:hypothetical protein